MGKLLEASPSLTLSVGPGDSRRYPCVTKNPQCYQVMRTLEQRLAANLRQRRGDATQREFARRLGVSVATVNRLEKGFQNVSLSTLATICARLKCDIGEIFDSP